MTDSGWKTYKGPTWSETAERHPNDYHARLMTYLEVFGVEVNRILVAAPVQKVLMNQIKDILRMEDETRKLAEGFKTDSKDDQDMTFYFDHMLLDYQNAAREAAFMIRRLESARLTAMDAQRAAEAEALETRASEAAFDQATAEAERLARLDPNHDDKI